ncbi:hypothetical protein ACQP1O_02785 [Nocardia sp. CA-151230]|uniref:hypothetical protein n=1 Tax=Nocardia sp. CA-151230 TaxID=3239982 RepID=UPI003D8F0A52
MPFGLTAAQTRAAAADPGSLRLSGASDLQPVTGGAVRVPIGLDALEYCPDTPGPGRGWCSPVMLEVRCAVIYQKPHSACSAGCRWSGTTAI